MDPLTWVYLALLAAGTAAQDQAVRKVDRETTKAQAENRDLRAEREKQSQALAKESEQAVLQTKDKQAARAKELADQYAIPQDVAQPTGAPGESQLLSGTPPTSSTVTVDNFNRGAAKLKSQNDLAAALRGQVGSYGSVMNDAGMTLGQNAADVRRNEKSMYDWTNYVLPARLAAAGQSGRDWSTAGDIMKLAAAVTGAYAMSAPSAGAQATTESGNIGQSIQAAKAPWLDTTQPAMQGGSVPFGSSYGAADAQAGYLQSLGMDVPAQVGARAIASPGAARMYKPLASGFSQPMGSSAGGAVDPFGMTSDGMFDPYFWAKMRKPNYVMKY